LYTGVGDLLLTIQQKLETSNFHFNESAENEADDSLSVAELFLIGPYAANPIKIVQDVAAQDKHISILVVTHPAQFNKVKQSLQFAPFVGKNAVCIAYTANLDWPALLGNATSRTQQRRSFSKINKVPQAATSIASSAVKVENFGIFLEQAPIGALLVNEQSHVLAINQKAKQLFEVQDQQLYELKNFFPGLSLQQLKMGLSPGNASKVVQASSMFLELHVSEVKNEEGRALHILLVNDITEQKRKEKSLRESEALFRFMAEAMPQKVWTADEKGELNFFNQHWTAYTGKTAGELKAWGWLNTIHPEDAVQNQQVWRDAIDTGNNFEFEQRILRKDGQYRWHLVRGLPRKDPFGKVLMWIGTNTDIHEQKAFAEELGKKVQERTYELENSNHELEQFVYVTSHDLQEPLRKIRMFTEIVKGTLDKIDPISQKHLDKVSATAARMSALLKDLLNFTQMSRQEQFVETNLDEIVSKAQLDLELLISEKRAMIKAEGLPNISAIPVQMHQLFYNLINNALKFSQPGVPPVIEISAKTAGPKQMETFQSRDVDKQYFEIVVKDNGIGFEQSYAEQIFNIFQRLHSRTEFSGTGIGLALCKKVVVNHHGSIYALSEKGKGAAFHILLPSNLT
jgi:PAS domain S-box-containing protein